MQEPESDDFSEKLNFKEEGELSMEGSMDELEEEEKEEEPEPTLDEAERVETMKKNPKGRKPKPSTHDLGFFDGAMSARHLEQYDSAKASVTELA